MNEMTIEEYMKLSRDHADASPRLHNNIIRINGGNETWQFEKKYYETGIKVILMDKDEIIGEDFIDNETLFKSNRRTIQDFIVNLWNSKYSNHFEDAFSAEYWKENNNAK